MGYYTVYNLVIDTDEDDETDQKVYDYIEKEYDLHFDNNGGIYDKWYDHEEQMMDISEKFPKYVFKLYGYGEDATDIWAKYFQNGEIQNDPVEIIYPECKFHIKE